MAKVYGGRWEGMDAPPLGGGGQGRVYRVTDRTGQLPGDFALKYVFNIERRERFRREVEAIKRLTDPETHAAHPNIVSIIDHSALDESGDTEKQFLVMRIAKGGDLSSPGRLALYKDSIDAVVQVAKQIATALDVAHRAEIIHRDVKPQNILFTGNGHELWLSDFGICLIREATRLTETPERVGPRDFMAPELENGGKLDVTASVDIYSLGKVIYFMLSGGVVLPREDLHEPEFRKIFDRGQRFQLMELLLRRMICPLDRRIASATEVLNELTKIDEWENNAQLLPTTSKALAAIQKLQHRSVETGRIQQENAQARQQENDIRNSVHASVTEWLTTELQKLTPFVQTESISCTVQRAALPEKFAFQTGLNSVYQALNGIELTYDDHHDKAGRINSLQFFICEHRRGVVQIHTGPLPPPLDIPPRATEFAIIPLFRQTLKHRHPSNTSALGYLSKPEMVGKDQGRLKMPLGGQRWRLQPQILNNRVEQIMGSFEAEVALHVEFRASQWPAAVMDINKLIEQATEVFFTLIAS